VDVLEKERQEDGEEAGDGALIVQIVQVVEIVQIVNVVLGY
jgi:hypothetical protein